ncbi:hypothetical protein, partial [Thermoleptolyngbya sp.]
ASNPVGKGRVEQPGRNSGDDWASAVVMKQRNINSLKRLRSWTISRGRSPREIVRNPDNSPQVRKSCQNCKSKIENRYNRWHGGVLKIW